MIVTGHAGGLRKPLILHRRLEHHAVCKLVYHRALNFLPGRLARRELESAAVLKDKAALRQVRLGDQNIGAALVEVDTDAVAGAQQRKTAVRGRLWRGVEDRGRTRCTGLPAVAD